MQTGFVGLGAMGANMARNLHRAGLLTGVWNRTTEKSQALAAELKVHAFANLTELAGNCEAVVICVSADKDLREVVMIDYLTCAYDFVLNLYMRFAPASLAWSRALLRISDDHPSFRIGAYTFGGVRDFLSNDKVSLGIGSDLTFYSKPAILDRIYGANPVSWKLFFRIRPAKMDMSMEGMHGNANEESKPPNP